MKRRIGPAFAIVLLVAAASCSRGRTAAGDAATPPRPSDAGAVEQPPLGRVIVSVAAPGASAGELETSLASTLEEALAALPGLRRLETRIVAGAVRVTAYVEGDADPVLPDLRARLRDVQRQLPESALPAQIASVPADVVALHYVLRGTGRAPAELGRLAEQFVRPQLLAVPGALDDGACGVRTERVLVRADPARLAASGIDGAGLAAALRAETLEAAASAGELETAAGTTVLRTAGGPASIESLGELPLGSSVRLRDVAEIALDAAPPACLAVRGDESIVSGRVLVRGEARARMREAGDMLAAELPAGVSFAWLETSGGPVLEGCVALPEGVAGAERERLARVLSAQLVAAGAAEAIVGCASDDCESAEPSRLEFAVRGPGEAGATEAALRRAVVAQAAAVPSLGTVTFDAGDPGEATVIVSGLDRQALPSAADAVAAALRTAFPAFDASVVAAGDMPVLRLEFDRERLAAIGVAVSAANEAFAACAGETEVGELSAGDARLVVAAEQAGPTDGSPGAVAERCRDATIGTPAGEQVPLSSVAAFTAAAEPALLERLDRRPAVRVLIRASEGGTRPDAAALDQVLACLVLPPGVSAVRDGAGGR